MRGLQHALTLIYPDQCVLCPRLVDGVGSLCAECWRDMPFLVGAVCDLCGASLPGSEDDHINHCDDCLAMQRPWSKGRAALSYRDSARRMVLALKHGDRTELARPAAVWMANAGRCLLENGTLLVPVPVHWSRLLVRRYNQSAELVRAIAALSGLTACPDALTRTRRTSVQDGMSVDTRFANLANAICANPKRAGIIRGANICLVDDVLTSGATLAAATEACYAAGANRVSVLVLARVEKRP